MNFDGPSDDQVVAYLSFVVAAAAAVYEIVVAAEAGTYYLLVCWMVVACW